MSRHILRYESPEQFVRVPSGVVPGVVDVDGWTVSEKLSEMSPEVTANGIASYRIVLERAVGASDELGDAYWPAHKLADDLSLAWCVLCGWVFEDCSMGGACNADPRGWKSNYNSVSVEIQRDDGEFVFEAAQSWSYRCVTFPFMPLVRVIDVRSKLQSAPTSILELAKLYREARASRDLMLLSKALELVGRNYGKSRTTRNAGLQNFINSNFAPGLITETADWMFTKANTRFETRHGVDIDSPTFALAQPMTQKEAADYATNAGRTIRGFICSELGVQMVVSRHN